MATLLLSAAGAALGGGFGGTVLGLSGAVIGRAVGATLGRAIDQRLMGGGSEAVAVGRVDRFRLMSAGEGQPVPRIWGRMRLGGHVIWASDFVEHVERQGGGKGTPSPKTESFSYSVSLAVALCEGEILRVGRIWADGEEVDTASLNLRVYKGGGAQIADPKIQAVEGAGRAPAYRGIAYVVFEDLDLARFGNRVPQFSFEVVRAAKAAAAGLERLVEAVALIPGTGEYTLAQSVVSEISGPGEGREVNRNTASSLSDFDVSLEQLSEELPAVGACSLVVSWFGDDLRCDHCEIRPMVEQAGVEGDQIAWCAGGIGRAEAGLMAQKDGRPVYGGTPADGAVLEAIAGLKAAGKAVMFYPFILMTQGEGNTLIDPWTGGAGQPALPWRGRITLSLAPNVAGSPDGTNAAESEVAAFFGAANPEDFSWVEGRMEYSGDPEDWGYRRFILHYASLCAQAGGIDAFCIGSELRGLTQIRGAEHSFPVVAQLIRLVGEVRAILGPSCKISYAADWSEYAGYTSPEGNRYFHLDPLWADPDVDFIGVDNYLPIADWREGADHRDASWRDGTRLDYLMANVGAGEYFDWYYDSAESAALQRRSPITDGAYDEPWVWRQKDFLNWWRNPHHERIAGERLTAPTAWQACSKPIWFTELGCPAVDKGANRPNLFWDAKSSESALPTGSTGRRDDYIQLQYLRAMVGYWGEAAHNPQSPLYDGPMVDLSRAFVWTWDLRPFPQFPGQSERWSDGENYARGHWLNGRSTNQPLASVVEEICAARGIAAVDTSGLRGVVRGYMLGEVSSGRADLQGLMLAHGFDAIDRGDRLSFVMRGEAPRAHLEREALAQHPEVEGAVEVTRAPEAEVTGRVRLSYFEAEADFAARLEEASFPDEEATRASQTELAMLMTPPEARALGERWLSEAHVAREGLRFALPPSLDWIGAGDVVTIGGQEGSYRIDRCERDGVVLYEAVRVEAAVYRPSDMVETTASPKAHGGAGPLLGLYLDLPLLRDGQDPAAPFVALSASPWPGPVGIWSAESEDGFRLNRTALIPSAIGITETPLAWARADLFDRGAALRVRMLRGNLGSVSDGQLFNGANAVAIGDGTPSNWEIMQFGHCTPSGTRRYDLTRRIRGLFGTDALMPQVWPEGSYVVVLDPSLVALDHPADLRGLMRHYRISPLSRGMDDPRALAQRLAFEGIGLRPLSPVHLRAKVEVGAITLSWVRRGRVDAESWMGEDIPLGESAERYRLRIWQGGILRREVTVAVPNWRYPDAERVADGITGDWAVEVAQISERFGSGPFTRLEIAG